MSGPQICADAGNALAGAIGLAGLYAAFGWLGLSLAVSPGYASPVFPAAGLALALALPAHAQGVIKIGEINSYKAQPAFLEPYKKGMELAVDEINAAGGVNGKKIQLISRDDNANPGDAVRVAEQQQRGGVCHADRGDTETDGKEEQIGRASCRERV